MDVEDAPDEVDVVSGAVVAGVQGHALLCRSGSRVAVWQVAADGAPSGAWVIDDPVRAQNQASARQVLIWVERRAIAGVDLAEAHAYLAQLARQAGVDLPKAYADNLVDLRSLGTQINKVRHELAQTVEAHEAAAQGRKLQPLESLYAVPDCLPDQVADGLHQLGLALVEAPDAEPVAREAVGQARLLRGWVRAWADTETTRLRRKYLTRPDAGGVQARVLPDDWLARLRAVYPATFEFGD